MPSTLLVFVLLAVAAVVLHRVLPEHPHVDRLLVTLVVLALVITQPDQVGAVALPLLEGLVGLVPGGPGP